MAVFITKAVKGKEDGEGNQSLKLLFEILILSSLLRKKKESENTFDIPTFL